MYITTVTKKNRYSPRIFEYQRLVESVRTAEGPRQRLLLNLGNLSLPESKWALLARRIEDIIRGQETLLSLDPEVQVLAEKYAEEIIRKMEAESVEVEPAVCELVAMDSLRNLRPRLIGAEYAGLSYLRKLDLAGCLERCGLSQRQIEIACLLIIGRMVYPGSEKRTHEMAHHVSGLDELLNTDFHHVSLNSLYRVSDTILKHKEKIEKHLCAKERDLFSLDEKIILYDLTNTFFEGQAAQNAKAKFGRSKDKRYDCRLVTLGLVIDGNGFPKTSKIYPGNQSEPVTLSEMVGELITQGAVAYAPKTRNDGASPQKDDKITVVVDAGLATEENLEKLKQDYHYICVSRKKMKPPDSDDFIIIKNEKENKVEAHYIKHGDEVFLYCKTTLKQKKEKAIQSRYEQYFEEELKRIASAIKKKGGIKNYQKVWERIGRAKEKYSKIARFYDISVEQKDARAVNVTWTYTKKEDSDNRFSGSYYLRTDRTDLTEKQIWNTYTMLTDLEDAFRTMKSEIGIRPNYHQKEHRSDAHIFITLLAYHIVHSIRTTLKRTGIHWRWKAIRTFLSNHCVITNRMKTKDGKTIYRRQCSEPESIQKLIYDALKLNRIPCKPKKFTV
jgi:hypothetical protein